MTPLPRGWRSQGSAAVLGVLALWAVVGLARSVALVSPPPTPTGQEIMPLVSFAQQVIPPGGTYLYVDPPEDGSVLGDEPRLRYELYPRTFVNASPTIDEPAAQALVADGHVQFIVVPLAHLYPETSWLRQDRPWFTRLALDDDRFVLQVTT